MANDIKHSHFAQHQHLHGRHAQPGRLLFLRSPDTSGNDKGGHDTGVSGDQQSFVKTHAGALTIAVAAAVPILLAAVVLAVLHRRVRRKQRLEDINDKHASLDFGLDVVPASKKTRLPKLPEMTITDVEKQIGARQRGMSLAHDSPFVLPPGLHGSHESLHSLSRSLRDSADPYRPVTFSKSDHQASFSRPSYKDNSSVYSRSSERTNDAANAQLLANATRMSVSHPLRKPVPQPSSGTLAREDSDPFQIKDNVASSPTPSADSLVGVAAAAPQDLLADTAPSHVTYPQPARATHDLPPPPDAFVQRPVMPNDFGKSNTPRPGEGLMIQVPPPVQSRSSPDRSPASMTPQHALAQEPEPLDTLYPPQVQEYEHGAGQRLSVMGMRPLPPDDPSDNPEQRANRIRSFYREYFDESKPNPPGHYPQQYQHPYGLAEEDDDYDYNAFADYGGAVYDPASGAFYSVDQPTAAPPRNAMTPPARSAASFRGSGHRSTASTMTGSHARSLPKKRLPPPAALQSLPTPHMLHKADLVGGMSPIDFAPPTSFRDRQMGRRPDSPLGSARPYSPAFKAHMPLVKSYDDLAIMPSPHSLRKSGLFTALDFAPRPRFRGQGDTGSDAGSIRSNRSGISQRQAIAIRDGAYRLSRLPKDNVGTTADLAQTLKPKWDIGRP